MSIHVVIKRRRQTVFLQCQLSDTVAHVKERISTILGFQVNHQQLFHKEVLLSDCAHLEQFATFTDNAEGLEDLRFELSPNNIHDEEGQESHHEN